MEALSRKTDAELAELVQGKNEQAFGVLMNRYLPKLLRYGRKFLATDAPIEDVVQEVFIRVYQNIKSFDTTRPFSPWIYRIAHNLFANALRHDSRHPLLTVDLDTLSAHTAYEIDPAENALITKSPASRSTRSPFHSRNAEPTCSATVPSSAPSSRPVSPKRRRNGSAT